MHYSIVHRWLWVLIVAVGFLQPLAGAESPASTLPLRILLVTGGHDFETNAFHRLFQEIPGLKVTPVTHPKAWEHLRPEKAADYDLLVFYDMWQSITEQDKANLLTWLGKGKGLVSLHHSLANYQAWPEYIRILGGRYNLEKRTQGGTEIPQSTYLHDVNFRVKVADAQHPVTKGLSAFDIHDETYGKLEVAPSAHPLLTTEEPTSHPVIGWANQYGTARVVYLQLGHDHFAYENPAYRQLITQSMRWCAKRD